MKLASETKPGTYFFYCNYHGPLMSGKVVVKPKGSSIPSQEEVNKQARAEIEKFASPLRAELEKVKSGKLEPPDEVKPALREAGFLRGRFFQGNLAGVYTDEEEVHGGINEFVPRTINVKAGDKVSWIVLGFHTISFNVPKYLPIISVRTDGRVELNPKVREPAGGAPAPPEESEAEEPSEPQPLEIDGGTFDGTGFWSSGLFGGDPYAQYSVRFAKPGKYRYACLIHPPMIGTVVVQ